MNKEAVNAHAMYMEALNRNFALLQELNQAKELIGKQQSIIESQQKTFAVAIEMAQLALAKSKAQTLQKLEVPHV